MKKLWDTKEELTQKSTRGACVRDKMGFPSALHPADVQNIKLGKKMSDFDSVLRDCLGLNPDDHKTVQDELLGEMYDRSVTYNDNLLAALLLIDRLGRDADLEILKESEDHEKKQIRDLVHRMIHNPQKAIGTAYFVRPKMRILDNPGEIPEKRIRNFMRLNGQIGHEKAGVRMRSLDDAMTKDLKTSGLSFFPGQEVLFRRKILHDIMKENHDVFKHMSLKRLRDPPIKGSLAEIIQKVAEKNHDQKYEKVKKDAPVEDSLENWVKLLLEENWHSQEDRYKCLIHAAFADRALWKNQDGKNGSVCPELAKSKQIHIPEELLHYLNHSD